MNSMTVSLTTLALVLSTAVHATPSQELLAGYATAAKSATPGFAGFSAARGKTLHTQAFAAGKADTPACTTCHGSDTRGAGRSPTGKLIEPMAVSVSPARYSDPAKVEKWFTRNCKEVVGRECSAGEKADFIAFLAEVR